MRALGVAAALTSGVNALEPQPLLAYYSGISPNTFAQGGINSLALAFFAPQALGGGSGCDFTDMSTPCLTPASGAGTQLGLKWAIDLISSSAAALKSASTPGEKPLVFFSFGGMSEGGSAWDSIFSSDGSAAQMGKNAAALVNAVEAATAGVANIGIDLDVEGMNTNMPSFPAFVNAFRADTNFSKHPLMLCTLSGIAGSDSTDHFKLKFMQEHGPKQGGVNFLNLMVDNQAPTCESMSGYWRDPGLDFLDPSARLLGMWGTNNAGWIFKNPGCTDGSSPLFPWMKSNSVGVAIWQWWSGDPSPVANVIAQIRAGGTPAPSPVPTPTPTPSPVPTPSPTPTPTPTPGACHSISTVVDDAWCEGNCKHVPPNCPASFCECDKAVVV